MFLCTQLINQIGQPNQNTHLIFYVYEYVLLHFVTSRTGRCFGVTSYYFTCYWCFPNTYKNIFFRSHLLLFAYKFTFEKVEVYSLFEKNNLLIEKLCLTICLREDKSSARRGPASDQ